MASVENVTRSEDLMAKLSGARKRLAESPELETVRQVCIEARALFSALEEEAIWKQSIDEKSRESIIQELVLSKSELDNIAEKTDKYKLKYIRILIAMSERIEYVRHSTVKVIEERLDEYATKCASSSD